MPRGRHPAAGTAEEKAAARREKVRLNVRAFRQRQKAASEVPVTKTPPTQKALRWVEVSTWQTLASDSEHQPATSSSSSSSDGGITPSQSSGSDINASDPVPDLTLPSKAIISSSSVPPSPYAGTHYSLALLGFFRSRFLPEKISLPSPDPSMTLRTPCAFWVTAACTLAAEQDVGPLMDVLISLSMSLVALDSNRPDLHMISQQFYRRTLKKIRFDVQSILDGSYNPTTSDVRALLLCCHAAAVFEGYENQSPANMMRHVKGIGLLIEHQSDRQGFMSDLGHNFLEEYRLLEIILCFIQRQLSTLGRRQRLLAKDPNSNEPRADRSSKKSMLSQLLDICDKVLPIMVQFDALKQEGISVSDLPQLGRYVRSLIRVHAELKRWMDLLESRHGPVYIISDAQDASQTSGPKLYFTTFELAFAWCNSLSAKIYTLETYIEILACSATLYKKSPEFQAQYKLGSMHAEIRRLRSTSLQSATRLANSLSYFFEADTGLIGRSIMTFPLEASFHGLENELRRLREDEAVNNCLETPNLQTRTELSDKIQDAILSLNLCYELAAQARMHGMPLLVDR